MKTLPLYAGLDAHQEFTVGTVVDEAGNAVRELKKVMHRRILMEVKLIVIAGFGLSDLFSLSYGNRGERKQPKQCLGKVGKQQRGS